MITLLKKELRQLGPIFWLWLAVLALGYATEFLGSRTDEETFGGFFEELLAVGSNPSIAAVQALLALVTAWSLFPREHDDSTIDVLRALPVSRGAIFVAKVLAGWLVLVVITLLSYGIDALLLAWNPESIGGLFYGDTFVTLIWRDLAFHFVVLSHGVLLSWFRITGLLLYAAYLIGVAWLESTAGSAGLFSVLNMMDNRFDGSRLIVDTTAIAVHVGVALVALLIAHRLWSRSESAIGGGRRRSRQNALLGKAVTAVAFVALGGALLTRLAPGGTGGTGGGPTGVQRELAVANSDHYRFVYAAEDRATLDYLLEHADVDFVELGRLLGTDRLPTVRVNLAAASEHAAGLATWKTILMDLDTFERDVSQRRVLSHESVHVMQAVLSERALARHASAARFFVEGMAQYLSFTIVPERERRASNRAIAAVAWQRQEIRFENLIDADFAQRFDPDLYYTLGDLWSESFARVCGEDGFGDFLRAAGRDDVPRRLAPAIFWRDTLGHIGCELETVNAHFRDAMQTLYDATDRRRFPRFEDVTVERLDDGRVEIEARLVADDGTSDGGVLDRADLPASFSARIGGRASLVASVDPVFRGEVIDAEDGLRVRFRIPPRAIPRARFDYQLGYAPYGDSRVWFDKRRRGAVAPSG